MNCNSSRSGTKVSCLRRRRRKILLSLSTTPRAASGSKRISEETVLRVLNKKWGLIWLESASMRALSSNCWWRSRFISTRVLFQIFSGAATDMTVAKTHSPSHQFQCGSMANSHLGLVAMASATRPSSRPTHASRGRRRHGQPLVRHQRGNGDDGAANRPHDAAAEQTHQERAFERKIGEAVRESDQTQRDADNQRRRHEQHQLQLLVGIALFGEQHAAKGVPARQERRKRRGYAHFQQQRKQQVLDGGQRVHVSAGFSPSL